MFKLSMLLGLALILAPSVIQAKSLCRRSGYFAIVDNTPDFYACQATGFGGFSMRFLRCPAGLVFSSASAQCIASPISTFEARDDSNIESPTIPPTTEAPATTEKTATKQPVNSETATNEPDTNEPVTGDSSSDVPDTDTTDVTNTNDSTDVTNTNDSTDVTNTTDSTDSTDVTNTNDSTDVTNTTDSTDVTNTTDSTDVTNTNDSTDVTNTTDSTDVTTTTDNDSGSTVESYPCPTTGFYPSSNSCSSFILCFHNDENKLQSHVLQCPGGMEFDPFNSFCSVNYNCNA